MKVKSCNVNEKVQNRGHRSARVCYVRFMKCASVQCRYVINNNVTAVYECHVGPRYRDEVVLRDPSEW
jgi:hypothetical protein